MDLREKPIKTALSERKRADFFLSVTALQLIAALSSHLGIGKRHVVELAVRDMAKKRGVK